MKDLATRITEDLRKVGTAARAAQEKAYLKSDLGFLGVSVPDMRRIAKQVRADQPNLGHDGLIDLVNALWAVPVHERRMVAVELLGLYSAELGPGDLGLLERLLRESGTWALVDSLAAHLVGGVIERYPESAATLDRWVGDEDFWIRRAALLALLTSLRRGEGDVERFFRYADQLLEEREFFIRKAIGWVLRDMGRKRPDLVRDWLSPRTDRVSGVTLREAAKYLAPADAAVLLTAYRAKVPATKAPTN
jgi:3-methyladenine DNA glycosylase AlkD